MEKLINKYKVLVKAQQAFDRASNLYKNLPTISDQALQEALTASVIKHFELYYETLCK